MKKKSVASGSKIYKVIKRQCVCCGKDLEITVFENRKYIGGHYFDMNLKEGEYWECEKCYS